MEGDLIKNDPYFQVESGYKTLALRFQEKRFAVLILVVK
jgi:hypothetical protein